MVRTTFTEAMANAMDRLINPGAQLTRIGTRIKEAFDRLLGLESSALQIVELTINADATGAPSFVLDADNPVRIVDAFTRCTGANASVAMTLQDSGGAAISNAMTCAVDKAIGRATSLDPAKCTIAAGNTVKVDANGAADRGVVTLLVVRV